MKRMLGYRASAAPGREIVTPKTKATTRPTITTRHIDRNIRKLQYRKSGLLTTKILIVFDKDQRRTGCKDGIRRAAQLDYRQLFLFVARLTSLEVVSIPVSGGWWQSEAMPQLRISGASLRSVASHPIGERRFETASSSYKRGRCANARLPLVALVSLTGQRSIRNTTTEDGEDWNIAQSKERRVRFKPIRGGGFAGPGFASRK